MVVRKGTVEYSERKIRLIEQVIYSKAQKYKITLREITTQHNLSLRTQ